MTGIIKAVAVVGPAATREQIDAAVASMMARASEKLGPGTPPRALMVVDRTGYNTVVRAMVGRME
jgi:hypothetical protein